MADQLIDQLQQTLAGGSCKDKVWLVKYDPGKQPAFFRLFTNWTEMLDSLSLPPEEQHPAWTHPFEIWQIDFESCETQEISMEVLCVVERREQWKRRTSRS